MGDNERLKLFISYSHLDESEVNIFIKHIAPLKTSGLIEKWYDRKITAGKDYQNEIDNNLDDADVICLFISANFLSSDACLEEKSIAFKFMKQKGTSVIPIILKPCGWLDDNELSKLLALPTDGKPTSKFEDKDTAFNEVYKGIKIALQNEMKIKQLWIRDSFWEFLNNTELLSKAHSRKEQVLLEDIFVYPELSKYDELRTYEKKISSKIVIKNFYDFSKILIAGESQSGKTTLCKKLFIELKNKNYVPIYLFDRTYQYHGKIENRIAAAFKEQYKNVSIEEIDRNRIVPIIDDFHLAKKKEKHILDLSNFKHQVIVVDDIFGLNLRDERLISLFIHLKIEEFTPSLRNKLIKKWTRLNDKTDGLLITDNDIYKIIDEKTELVNTTLGKIFGRGIMPSHPFFVLSIISTYDTFAKPLDEEITSQGYCYQAFIYMYLRKQGVKNDDIDTYINFLTEFAFFIYSKDKNEISKDQFDSFMDSYLKKFNLPIKQDTLINKLRKSKIIALDNFNNYFFCYRYLHFFFIAKYLAEHSGDNKKIINKIINNLHKSENAYISIFVSHHSKSDEILDEIILNALCLFDEHEPATLSEVELEFFNKQEGEIVKAVLPPSNITPEIERERRLTLAQNSENLKTIDKKETPLEENEDLARELRRSIKTVEVIGCIIKNRAGSLDKARLESMFEEAMDVHLRILTSFFKIIKEKSEQDIIIDFISNRLDYIIKKKSEERLKDGKKDREPTHEELEKISQNIFWNLNFLTVYGLIDKIINSIGSSKLTKIAETVCDKRNTPAAYIIKHGILMWYNKNLQVDIIAEKIDNDGFSSIAKRLMDFLVVNHCSMHKITYREKQKIEQKLGIASKRLLECKLKE